MNNYLRFQTFDYNQSMVHPQLRKVVTAFIVRKNKRIPELLVHSFEDDQTLPFRLPGGGMLINESPSEALFRELREETGRSSYEIVRKLGVQRYFKSYLNCNIERHDYLLFPIETLPDYWKHRVSGNDEDEGDIFHFYWKESTSVDDIDIEHRRFLVKEYIPEFF